MITALSNSMKPSHACGATQDRRVTVERSEERGPLEKGMASHFSILAFMNSMKRQYDRIPKKELLRSLGAQYATEEQWRNNSRKNEGMAPKQKQYSVVDVTGDRSKIRCCKEQYWEPGMSGP